MCLSGVIFEVMFIVIVIFGQDLKGYDFFDFVNGIYFFGKDVIKLGNFGSVVFLYYG